VGVNLKSANRPVASLMKANTGFSELDIAAATVVVKRLARAGKRKGPPDWLLVEPRAWWREDAIAYLIERKEGRDAQGNEGAQAV
jgi:hypothetical protein